MKKSLILFVLVISVMINACAPAKDTTGVWVNKEKSQGKKFNKIFVIALTGNIQARVRLENKLADIIKSKGLDAVKSVESIPPNISDPKPANKDSVWAKIQSSGCDAVFVSSVLNKEEDVRYVAGGDAYSITNYYSWQGDFFGYYSHWAQTVYNPGYFEKNKTYFVQSNLYDVKSKEVMWSVQSKVFNPSSISSFSKSYTASLIKKLEDSQLIKKAPK